MLVLYVHDEVLDLKRKLIGVAVGTPASVGQPLNATFLVAIENLVARLARDPKLPAKSSPNTPSKASTSSLKKEKV
jgi:hypothetical protein